MVSYLAKSSMAKTITEPINTGVIRYYSLHNDGSSSAKTNDEKELFVIKTAQSGVPKFSLMSLEEPENTDAVGLKKAMEKSFSKLNLEIQRSDHEIGLCSDGASVNMVLFNLVKEDIGDHYIHTWCPSHRLELAIGDAFKDSTLNTICEKSCMQTYYLFKSATLRWRLFKRQAIIEDIQKKKYKRPSGTRWVEHQHQNLQSHNHNFPILLAFLNQQISSPHNASIKKVKSTLEGLNKDLSHTDRVIFNSVKEDVLSILQPLSKTLQACELIVPSLITACNRTLKIMGKLRKLLQQEGINAFKNVQIFPSTSHLLGKLANEENEIVPARVTRADVASGSFGTYTLYHGYLLNGSLDYAMNKVLDEFKDITDTLCDSLKTRLDPIVNEEIFAAVAMLLDTENFRFISFEAIHEKLAIVLKRFSKLLDANGCEQSRLFGEMEVIFDHVKLFLPTTPLSKAWPSLFAKQKELGIENAIHVAEICLAMPLSNAEIERIFSFLWRVFSKDRQSFKDEGLENLIRLKCDNDTSPERYEHAIEMFLSVHPNGELRKTPRRPDGYNIIAKKVRRTDQITSPSEAIDLAVSDDESEKEIPDVDTISSDEWTDDSDADQ